jgi:DNA-binding MarR family transcriptional regulator
MLGSTDIYIVAGVFAAHSEGSTLRQLANILKVDHTLVHRALKRAETAGLYASSSKRVHRANFEELLTHAARFIAPARLGGLTPGMPAAWATKPISTLVRQHTPEPPPVWPDAQGSVRGQALEPLHPAAIEASHESPELAELLAIIDSLRAGDVRIRKIAAEELRKTLRRTAAEREPQAE